MEFLQSGVLPTVLLVVRILVPLLALYVVWRCYTSFKKGQRRRDPVIMLVDEASGARFPVLYWKTPLAAAKAAISTCRTPPPSPGPCGAAAPGRGLVHL